MSHYTKEQFEEHYKKLPAILRRALHSPDNANLMIEMGKKHGLTIEEIGYAAEEIGFVILGLTPARLFVKALRERLNKSEDDIKKLAADSNHQVFYPLREELKKAHGFDLTAQAIQEGAGLPEQKKETYRPTVRPTPQPPSPPLPQKETERAAAPQEIPRTGIRPIDLRRSLQERGEMPTERGQTQTVREPAEREFTRMEETSKPLPQPPKPLPAPQPINPIQPFKPPPQPIKPAQSFKSPPQSVIPIQPKEPIKPREPIQPKMPVKPMPPPQPIEPISEKVPPLDLRKRNVPPFMPPPLPRQEQKPPRPVLSQAPKPPPARELPKSQEVRSETPASNPQKSPPPNLPIKETDLPQEPMREPKQQNLPAQPRSYEKGSDPYKELIE